MTILSKKKPTQGKPETEATETANHHAAPHPHTMGAIPNHPQAGQPLGSPQSWPLQREEKRGAHSSTGHESGSSHSKRRHRASPHRPTRTKLRERERGTASPPPSAGSPSQAGPSDRDEFNSSTGGYNSGDEYGFCDSQDLSEAEWVERDRRFEKMMRKRGFIVKPMGEDGACLFRSVADQVYGDQEMHAVVRNHCMDYIAANRDFFSQYVTEDLGSYVNRKRRHNVHGNHIEMQAMSEMYNRPVEVFCYRTDPINTFHGMHKTENEPIRLSYQRGSHYNSIVDPYKATIGVGLGLPGYSPGSADRSLIKDAARRSEDLAIEQTMLEDKMRATDWEATNEAIEEQVARDSYLQWIKDNEKRSKSSAPPSATVTSVDCRQSPRQSPRTRPAGASPRTSPRSSPSTSRDVSQCMASTSSCDTSLAGSSGAAAGSSSSAVGASPMAGPMAGPMASPMASPMAGPSTAYQATPTTHIEGFTLMESASFLNLLPPEMFGLREWDDTGILAQVLATSQQEYIDDLKKRSQLHPDDRPGPSHAGLAPPDCEAGPSTR